MIPFIVFTIACVMLIAEIKKPARNFPRVIGWWGRATIFNLLQFLIILIAGITWDLWLQKFHIFNLSYLTPTWGALTGYLTITFVFYWWHRLRHRISFLWRWVHQLHHSPKRLELITAFYKHPIELIADSMLSSFILFALLGLNLKAASYAILLSGIGELFYHWNVSTPYWVGFILQRPESHCIHHQENLHSYNYSDLPLWDMLFGTFRNPKNWKGKCGFSQHEERVGEMLEGVDVEPNKRRYHP